MATGVLVPRLGSSLLYVGLLFAGVRCHHRLLPILRVRVAYNLAMSAYSVYVACSVWVKLRSAGRDTIHAAFCDAGEGAPAFWHASKYAEWADTLFILASGRIPSTLHVFHHATTAPLVATNQWGATGAATSPTALFDLGTFLNGLVHAFMYAYYASPARFRFARRHITRLQIAQHCCVLTAVAYATLGGCDAPPVTEYLASCLAYGGYLLLFWRFYVAAYRRPRRDA